MARRLIYRGYSMEEAVDAVANDLRRIDKQIELSQSSKLPFYQIPNIHGVDVQSAIRESIRSSKQEEISFYNKFLNDDPVVDDMRLAFGLSAVDINAVLRVWRRSDSFIGIDEALKKAEQEGLYF